MTHTGALKDQTKDKMTYVEILKYIKANSARFLKTNLVDGIPEATSASLSVVALIFDKSTVDVINDYADTKL